MTIRSIAFEGFTAVPWLSETPLAKNHRCRIDLSSTKPNVVVGPNASGKSALLTTLSLLTLSHFTGASEISTDYVSARHADAWWTKTRGWSSDFEWLQNLVIDGAAGPAFYYRPEHIPGNEKSVASAMMLGYFDQAKAYGALVKGKSDGQKSALLLDRCLRALGGSGLPTLEVAEKGFRYAKPLEEMRQRNVHMWIGEDDRKGEAMRKRYLDPAAEGFQGLTGRPLVMLDEPERSLDALAEAQLWAQIAAAHTQCVQVLVATHSLYPLLHPHKFHLIESTPGWRERVLQESGLTV